MHKLISIGVAFICALGISEHAGAGNENAGATKIVTAIEVAALVENGASDGYIVRLLAEQRGISLTAPIFKGKSDTQKIQYLLNLPEPSKNDADKGKTAAHRTAGENFFKKGDYAKATQELTQAMKYSAGNLDINIYALYKARGDSYRDFVKATLSPATPTGQPEVSKQLLEKQRALICGAAYSDYRIANGLLDRSVRDGINEIERRNVRMKELKEGSDPTLQYKSKSGEYINIMRDMRRLLYRQASAKSEGKHLKASLENYRKICAAEEQTRSNQVRQARDTARDKKWVGYGEKDNATYFYDKATLRKEKDAVTVWSRKETTDDEASYDLARVRLDCRKKTFTTLETSSYGGDGSQLSRQQNKKAAARNVTPGTPEELLMGRICK